MEILFILPTGCSTISHNNRILFASGHYSKVHIKENCNLIENIMFLGPYGLMNESIISAQQKCQHPHGLHIAYLKVLLSLHISSTEHRGQMVDTPASYSEGHTVQISAQATRYPDRFFVVFLSPFRRMPGYSTLKLGHNHFLPNIFQFIIIRLSPYH
jgi:hypothetical protein